MNNNERVTVEAVCIGDPNRKMKIELLSKEEAKKLKLKSREPEPAELEKKEES